LFFLLALAGSSCFALGRALGRGERYEKGYREGFRDGETGSLARAARLIQLDARPAIAPAISQWRRSGGRTSERGSESVQVNTRGIFDEKGRLLVLMTHNTDISDTWEREGEDPEYFYRFSPDGYAIAINVMTYVLTH